MALAQRLGFIGSGNMATALIEGLIAAGTCEPRRITASDVRGDALATLAARLAIATTSDNRDAARTSDVIILSTKPQVLPAVLSEIATQLRADVLIISIAAGIPLQLIESRLPAGTRVVRAMPNTPALVRAGATAIAAGTAAGAAELDVAQVIFESVGIVERVAESLMDAVTGLSGSGPAYVFLLVEALTSAGVGVGLPEASAARLAAQTVFGAGKLLHGSALSPAELRRQVTSPAGTTAAGIERLQQLDFAGVVGDAVRRATERARELGAEATSKPAT